MIHDDSHWEIPSSIDLEGFLKKHKPDFKYKIDHFYYIVEDSLETKKIIHQWIKTTNKYLKRLSKLANLPISITTYSARYSFASISKQLGYSNEMIAEALGHEYGNRVTNIYLDAFDNNKLDEMHEDVISIDCA